MHILIILWLIMFSGTVTIASEIIWENEAKLKILKWWGYTITVPFVIHDTNNFLHQQYEILFSQSWQDCIPKFLQDIEVVGIHKLISKTDENFVQSMKEWVRYHLWAEISKSWCCQQPRQFHTCSSIHSRTVLSEVQWIFLFEWKTASVKISDV